MQKRFFRILLICQLVFAPKLFSQNIALNSTGSLPDTSAMLDISSSNKGFLMPRMTATQISSIPLPATGLIVYNTTINAFQVNTGTSSSPYWSTLGTTVGNWLTGGNSGLNSGQKFIGTTDSVSVRFRSNNIQRLVLDSLGNVAIGSSPSFSSNADKLLVDAGVTNSFNVITAKGNVNNYLQFNVQNQSSGASASSDLVATADNGSETSNYIDMGINGSAYTGGVMGASNDAYLFNIGNNLLFGTGTAAKSLIFMTGGTSEATNERMRIDGTGKVGIGTTSPGSTLDVKGTLRLSGSTSGYVGFAPAAAAGSTTYTLPTADGASGQALVTNGTGSLSWASVSGSTTHTLSSSGNTITSTVNGVTGTANAVNTVANTSSTNTLSTTVNGVAGTGVNIINSNTLGLSSGSLTSTVNGVASSSVSLTSLDSSIYKNDGTLQANRTVTMGADNLTFNSTTGNFIVNPSSTGKVGIGTASPASTLDVKGTLHLSGSTSGYVGFAPAAAAGSTTYTLPSADGTSGQQLTTSGTGTLTWTNAGGTTSNTIGTAGNIITSNVNGVSDTALAVTTVSNTSSANTLSTTVNGVAGTAVNIINSNALNLSGGNLTSTVNGLASSSVNLTAMDSNIYKNDGSLLANRTVTMGANNLTFSSTTGNIIFSPSSTGKVGIGIASPNYALQIHDATVNPSSGNWMQISNNASGSGSYNGLFYGVSAAGAPQIWAAGYLDIITGSGTTNNYSMHIDQNGKVGIGTTSPASTLDVKGTLHLSGSTSGYVGFAVPAAAGSTTYTLPSADGTNGQQLTTNGTGTLSWSSAASTTNTLSSSANIITSTVNGIAATANAVNTVANTSSTNTLTTTVNGVAATGVNIINSIALSLSGGNLTSTVNGVASSSLSLASLDSSIYKNDGTLQANRTVTMAADNLTFNSTTGNFVFNPSSTGKVGIGTASPASTLDVKGIFHISGATSGYVGFTVPAAAGTTTYTLPSADGTSGQQLTTSGTGVLSWTSASASTTNTLSSSGNVITSTVNGVAGTANAVNTVANTSSTNTLTTTVNGVAATGVNIINSIALSLSGGNLTSTVNGIASSSLSLASLDSSIYKNDGTLQANRTVTMAADNLTFNSTTGNFVFNPSSTGKFGIGTASPASTLDVKGIFHISGATSGYVGFTVPAAAGTTTYTLPSADGTSGQQLTTSGTGVLSWTSASASTTNTLSSSGNVITSTVNGVAGTANAVNTVANTSSTNTLTTTVNGVAATGVNIINSNALSLSGSNLTSTVNGVASSSLSLASLDSSIYKDDGTLQGNRVVTMGADNLTFNSTTGNFIVNPSSTGKVGIGTASPASTLDVKGTLHLSGSTSGYVGFAPAAAAGTTTYTLPSADGTSGQQLTTNGSGILSWVNAGGSTTHTISVAGNTLTSVVNGVSDTTSAITSNALSISSGNLTSTVNGIASSAVALPVSSANNGLSVSSNTIQLGGNLTQATTVTNNSNALNIAGSSSTTTFASTGYVGIGTTTPAKALHVVMNSSGTNVATFENSNAAGFSSMDYLDNTGTLSSTFGYANASAGGIFSGRAYMNSYAHDFVLTPNSTTYAILIQGTSGNVGINNASPGSTLDVKGTIRLSGSTSGYVGFAPAAAAGSTTYTLPAADGSSGQALVTNGTGTLSWANPSASITNTLSSSGNILTSTVNGITDTAKAITTNATSLSGSSLITTINGIASTSLDLTPAIGSVAWKVTGNSGLSSSNFIGTTDATDLIFKRNSVASGSLAASSTSFGVSSSVNATQGSAFGASATASGSASVAVGYNAEASMANGVSVGPNTQIQPASSSTDDIAIGNSANVTGAGVSSYSTAIGSSAQVQASNGLAIGKSSYVSSQYGMAIGDAAQSQATSAIAIGENAYANGTTSIAIGSGASASKTQSSGTNTIVIGTNLYDATDNTTAIGNSSSLAMLINGASYTTGRALVVGSGSTNGNGAYLTKGGTWTNASDRNLKEDFTPVNGEDILNKVASLDITHWKYKGTNEYHIGPMAQDFYKLFNLGTDDKHISTIDPSGIALISIKALKEENDQLKNKLAEQQSTIDELVKQVQEIKSKMK